MGEYRNELAMMVGRTAFEEYPGLLPVDHTLWQGESLGLYGLVGSGRTELAKNLIGEHNYDAGAVLVRGKPARIGSVAESLERNRIGYVSENRKEEGLILGASVSSNLTITIWNRLASRLLRVLGPRRDFDRAAKMIRRLDIKTPGSSCPTPRRQKRPPRGPEGIANLLMHQGPVSNVKCGLVKILVLPL